MRFHERLENYIKIEGVAFHDSFFEVKKVEIFKFYGILTPTFWRVKSNRDFLSFDTSAVE